MNQRRSRGGRGRGSGPGKEHGPRREHVPELHPTEEPPDIQTFDQWNLGPDIQRGIAAMDIVKPTPIQALSIGPVLAGRDVIAKAQTGTGKTLAFGAPMMSKIDAARATVLGLVLCPTRELAQQVHGVLATLGLPRGVRVAMCVGGDPIHPQIAQLQAGAQVVVGTPGRVLDLYQQRFLAFPWTEFVVLDEADKMFEIGFIDDIRKILSYTPEERQTLLFSATFPTEVLKLAREATRDPLEVATAAGTVTVDTVEQCFIPIDDEERPMALLRLLEQSGEKEVFLVFCARRTDVDRLMQRLQRAPFQIKALHGGYDQASRFRVMSAFRTGEVKALIATDVASRGLDVQHVTHVVNFSVPRDAEDYTHRIGRTGRAGRTGTAITFVTSRDRRNWSDILKRTKSEALELELPRRTGSRRPPRDAGAERPERPERSRTARGDRQEPRERAPEPADAFEEVEGTPEHVERESASAERTDSAAPAPEEPREERPGRRGRRGGRGRREREPVESVERAESPRSEAGSSAAPAAEPERAEREPRESRERRGHRDEPRRSDTSSADRSTRGERPARAERSAEPVEPAGRGAERERPRRAEGERSREEPAGGPRTGRGERTGRTQERGGERSREGQSGRREETRPAPERARRSTSREGSPERATTGAREGGAREGGATRERGAAEGPKVEDRSPEPRPRRRRRRPGATRPEPDRRDPDGLGRWGSRAEDFD